MQSWSLRGPLALQVDEFLGLTDEGILNDVLRHPALRNKQKFCFSSLSAEEQEALQEANALLQRVTRNRDLYRVVSTASFGHSRNMGHIRAVCTPELVARLGANGALKADDIVLDCT